MNLEEIKKRQERRWVEERDYAPWTQQMARDADWLIAEVERWKFDADTTREAHICTGKERDRLYAENQQLQADLAEAEKEIHARAEGEGKDWWGRR